VGPGVLQSQNVRIVPVQAGVLQGLPDLISGLSQVGQQGGCNTLVDVGGGLPGSHVDGQLVHDALERVGCRDLGERGVVGGSDAGVHRRRGRVVSKLEVHRSGRALAVHLDLKGVQGELVGFVGQARVRLVFVATRPLALAAMSPSAAAKSEARA